MLNDLIAKTLVFDELNSQNSSLFLSGGAIGKDVKYKNLALFTVGCYANNKDNIATKTNIQRVQDRFFKLTFFLHLLVAKNQPFL